MKTETIMIICYLLMFVGAVIQPIEKQLLYYISHNDYSSVKNIIDNKVGLTELSYSMPPLVAAGNAGRYKIASLLLDYGFEVDECDRSGFTPLKTAARNGHINLVKLFLDHGSNIIHEKNGTPLVWVANQGNVEMGQFLIDNGAPDMRGNGIRFPLHEAVRNNHIEFVQLLIKNKFNINIKNNKGYTALLYAVSNRNYDMVSLLINNLANPKILTNKKVNTFNYMCTKNKHQDKKICDLLTYVYRIHELVEVRKNKLKHNSKQELEYIEHVINDNWDAPYYLNLVEFYQDNFTESNVLMTSLLIESRSNQ